MGAWGVLLLESIEPTAFTNVVVAHCQLLTKPHIRNGDRLRIKLAKDQATAVVTMVHQQPHPFPLTRFVVHDFNLYVVTFVVASQYPLPLNFAWMAMSRF